MTFSERSMNPKRCEGGLTPKEIDDLDDETELRLYTCAVCGKRNLYALRDNLGKWTTEPHDQPSPRVKDEIKTK
jgi:hypothetical protein